MKRRGPEGPIQGSHETDPFRKMAHPDEGENLSFEEAGEIKKMKEKLIKEGKTSIIQLPENIEAGDPVPLFDEALSNKVKPEDIAFYSLATGVLQYQRHNPNIANKDITYRYYNPKNLDVWMIIDFNAKAKPPTKLTALSPNIDFLKLRETDKARFKDLVLGYEESIQDLTAAIKEDRLEKFAEANNAKDVYVEKLKTLKSNLKYLDSVIDEKIKEAEKKKK